MIHSSDPQAKIYVNGEFVGTGNGTHRDSRIVGSSNSVTLKKDGCREQFYSFSRDEELSVGALIGGILVWIPFLWIMKYKPMHNYDFVCEKV
jgi:hypothetical protein